MSLDVSCDVSNKETCVSVGRLTLWFSYRTLVAFQTSGELPVVRENDWGPTTGRMLNVLQPDKKKRVSGEEFVQQFKAVLKRFKLNY